MIISSHCSPAQLVTWVDGWSRMVSGEVGEVSESEVHGSEWLIWMADRGSFNAYMHAYWCEINDSFNVTKSGQPWWNMTNSLVNNGNWWSQWLILDMQSPLLANAAYSNPYTGEYAVMGEDYFQPGMCLSTSRSMTRRSCYFPAGKSDELVICCYSG